MNRKHGHAYSPTYRSWHHMVQRCTNPNNDSWSNYGGRGITVCDRWLKFANFLADMGERPDGRTLDRRDNNSNYEPSNCRWATPGEQTNNRRVYPQPRLIRVRGVPLQTWAYLLGVSLNTMRGRYHRGGSIITRNNTCRSLIKRGAIVR